MQRVYCCDYVYINVQKRQIWREWNELMGEGGCACVGKDVGQVILISAMKKKWTCVVNDHNRGSDVDQGIMMGLSEQETFEQDLKS